MVENLSMKSICVKERRRSTRSSALQKQIKYSENEDDDYFFDQEEMKVETVPRKANESKKESLREGRAKKTCQIRFLETKTEEVEKTLLTSSLKSEPEMLDNKSHHAFEWNREETEMKGESRDVPPVAMKVLQSVSPSTSKAASYCTDSLGLINSFRLTSLMMQYDSFQRLLTLDNFSSTLLSGKPLI